mmetsp:Transcript_8385/g.17400  ORF Transcript_8385/g.17400 Transcript_8385/m.17400 type:complete len:119 (-) Transcript_8385:186-542(-)
MFSKLCHHRVAVTQLSRMGRLGSRAFSTEGAAAVDKLKGALEEYRAKHYSQCIPTRFKKDIVRAAKDEKSEHVAIEGLEKVMANIGASQKVSRNDMEIIFSEIGESGRISTEKMFKLI